MTTQENRKGPPVYENWRAALENKEPLGAYEVPLFTDAHIIGMITDRYGPYQFINTVPGHEGYGTLNPSIILRVENYLRFELPLSSATKEDYYHGGWLADEVASLLSLCLGIRVKPGSITREFSPNGDPKGLPRAWTWTDDPVLLKSMRGPILPEAAGTHPLNDLAPMLTLPALNPSSVVALIRAARLYQDGLWISESEPNLSWIMLVSAIETAAGHWRAGNDSPLERLQTWNSDLVESLKQKGGDEFATQIAERIADLTGATKKFLEFILCYLPEPPENRPEVWAQHSWTKNALKKSLQKIYSYRSRALHGGTPFPAPMCFSPMRRTENTWEEKPSGLAAGTGDHNWLAKDIPLFLHTFEYIVRHSLVNWWKSMTASTEAPCV